jgi:hypothetical protein
VNDVNGTLYPLRQIPAGEDRLKGFLWLDKRRPKTKFELFESTIKGLCLTIF